MKTRGKKISFKDTGSKKIFSANFGWGGTPSFSRREERKEKSFWLSKFIPLRAKEAMGKYLIFLIIPFLLTFFFWPSSCSQKTRGEASGSPTPAQTQAASPEPALGASFQGQPGHSGHGEKAETTPKTATSSSEIETPAMKQKAAAKEEKTLYHCPMHPNYISDKPGECPICGMTLVPIEKEKEKESLSLPEGAIEISPGKQQLLGVTFGLVEKREVHQIISAYGRLTYDETRLTAVTTKFSGWVERLFVDYTGKLVKRGEPLFSIYSPDLIAAQEEYLLALRAQKTLAPRENSGQSQGRERSGESSAEKAQMKRLSLAADSNNKQGLSVMEGWPGEPTQSLANLVEAAKRRLLLWDISEAQIFQLERDGKPFRNLTLYAPVTGFVVEKNVVEGKFVMAGENLFSLADLSRVWLLADIYELDLPLIGLGRKVEAEFTSYPGEIFRGKITYIFPYFENKSRTVKIRVEFSNAGYKLKPEMYSRVKMHLMLGSRLTVPEEAVIDTGERKLVFVVHEINHFEPREVKLGFKAGDFYEILSGLTEGERVVTSAQFLIDSESRLKAAVRGFHQHPSEKKPEDKEKKTPTPPAKHVH